MSITFNEVSRTRSRPNDGVLSVLDRVSFEIPVGMKVAIIGPSGSGKTTLLRLINRLDDPERGRILLDGMDITSIDPPELRRNVGMVFQQPHLSDATVWENLNRPLMLAKRPTLTEESARRALERVDLPVSLLDVNTRELSVGQQQRVAIARALVLEPRVLLLDEPTSALDPRSAEVILRMIRNLSDELGLTVIMVSHTFEQANAFADTILAIRDGQARMFDEISAAVDWAMPVEAESEKPA